MRLPLFPLQSIFFPGEKIPLHIFEPRYLQLIYDCKNEAISFGIPVYLNQLMPFGVEVVLEEIVKLYSTGEMDIICRAKKVIKIVAFEKNMGDKLYSGGVVTIIEDIRDGEIEIKRRVVNKIQVLYQLMGIPSVQTLAEEFDSFTLAHKIGLSKSQEYKLLQISIESDRLRFIETHLDELIVVLKEVNRTKETIKFNGHFKNLDPLKFDDFKF
ncbi:LON peptidase substrate-binding domain-containing protein [Cellulophaga sp. HaHaR_3_176]|uniref:LON peptidase substrate-binding domain-containing protein n=1 Tax=Cellulophaga sp. HaHaR_3_176 TaxID=1942464 RepID=UPI001C1F828F|nr:LON peptidase substrate-binding domain-containing protein [Cellulophaga sp. HaHaR_3_176]QWX82728.1 LON peptidase substrate-binding domain-containing protein [Cellulophaga sp. HaHaR_3_176]